MNFSTNINDVKVYGLSKILGVQIDIDVESALCRIDWEVEIEAREWGVKSISVYVTKVICSIDWEVYKDSLTDDEKRKLIVAGREYKDTINATIDICSDEKREGKEWTIETNFGSDKNEAICPNEIEIDFETMTITIL